MDKDEQIKSIKFSIAERDMILKLLAVDLDMERRFSLAVCTCKNILVPMNAYDLAELSGSIAADANHTKKNLQKKLGIYSAGNLNRHRPYV